MPSTYRLVDGYQVKKEETRRAALRSARPQEPVASSLPGTGKGVGFPSTGVLANGSFGRKREERVADRYKLQADLVATLGRTRKHSHLAHRVAECHHSFRHKVCAYRHEWAEAGKSCNVRLCPHDQRRRSLQLAARWTGILEQLGELRYVVLAECNSRDLVAGMRSLFRAWSTLRKSPLWKSSCRGSVAVLEVTFNRDEGTWHPHLNVLFEGDYIPFEALKTAWIAATAGNGQTAFIRAADRGTITELLKYVTKLSDFVDQPDAVDEFLTATAHKRFVRTYGSFYRLETEDEEGTGHCPDCGTSEIADVGIAHADQIRIDAKGVLRINSALLRNSQLPASEDFMVAWPRAPVQHERDRAAWRELRDRVVAQENSRQVTVNKSHQEKTL